MDTRTTSAPPCLQAKSASLSSLVCCGYARTVNRCVQRVKSTVQRQLDAKYSAGRRSHARNRLEACKPYDCRVKNDVAKAAAPACFLSVHQNTKYGQAHLCACKLLLREIPPNVLAMRVFMARASTTTAESPPGTRLMRAPLI